MLAWTHGVGFFFCILSFVDWKGVIEGTLSIYKEAPKNDGNETKKDIPMCQKRRDTKLEAGVLYIDKDGASATTKEVNWRNEQFQLDHSTIECRVNDLVLECVVWFQYTVNNVGNGEEGCVIIDFL